LPVNDLNAPDMLRAMVLSLGTDRAFRTPDELATLVIAVVQADARSVQETHWLEWKGPLNIGKAEGQFAIAKAILGFANREPTRAASVCEGTAYLIVGAEPGSSPGITVVDHSDLGQGIGRYVNGPRWAPHYVDHGGIKVLVVVIEAPRVGDPIHTLQKANDRFYAGTVFHRGTAQSEPAGPRDITMLSDRLVQGVRDPDLALDLSAEAAAPLMRLYVNDEATQEWLDQREAYVRANSGKKPPKPPAPPATGLGGWPATTIMPSIGNFWMDEERYAKPGDAEKFEAKVEKHLDQCKDRLLDNVIREIVRSEENVVKLTVFNATDDPIIAVEVTARVPKVGLCVFNTAPPAAPMPGLPKWPTPLDDMFDNRVSQVPIPAYQFGPVNSSVIEHDDHFEIAWRVGNVLARTGSTLEVTILPGMQAPAEIEAELTARSTSHRGVARSTSALSLSPDTWHLSDWWE